MGEEKEEDWCLSNALNRVERSVGSLKLDRTRKQELKQPTPESAASRRHSGVHLGGISGTSERHLAATRTKGGSCQISIEKLLSYFGNQRIP